MSTNSNDAVARATAIIDRPKGTDAERAELTASISQAMTQSPDWNGATDLQAAVKVWTSAATAISTNAAATAQLRAQLKTYVAKQASLRAAWAVATSHMLSTATVLCAGNPARVTALGLDVESHKPLGPRGEVQGLTTARGKSSGQILVKWERGDARHGFLVQHATDPNTAATIVAQPWTKTRFTLSGVASGASVSFRVAPIDPSSATGIGPWTPWTAGTAR